MREIKFRQPLFSDGKFNQWLYWGYVDGGFVSPANGDLERQSQQYTGLLDKNGKEIYEGDIVKGGKPDYCDNVIGIVAYGGMAFHYIGKRENGDVWIDTITNAKYTEDRCVEVIGNIYENKELMP